VRVAGKIMGTQTISSLQDIFEHCNLQQANKILLDSSLRVCADELWSEIQGSIM